MMNGKKGLSFTAASASPSPPALIPSEKGLERREEWRKKRKRNRKEEEEEVEVEGGGKKTTKQPRGENGGSGQPGTTGTHFMCLCMQCLQLGAGREKV